MLKAPNALITGSDSACACMHGVTVTLNILSSLCKSTLHMLVVPQIKKRVSFRYGCTAL